MKQYSVVLGHLSYLSNLLENVFQTRLLLKQMGEKPHQHSELGSSHCCMLKDKKEKDIIEAIQLGKVHFKTILLTKLLNKINDGL